jgi:monoamine oxidase
MTGQRMAPMSRRRLLAMIGIAAGSSAMYQAMTTMGLAAESTYNGPIRLKGDPRGASVLILGRGLLASSRRSSCTGSATRCRF